MSDLLAIEEIETQSPARVYKSTAARELRLSRMLMAYIVTGLLFMLLPGTFLGVWNLLTISSNRAAGTVSAAWIQAHGHAQIFGWIGTFILGIGYYSIPKLRGAKLSALWRPWTSWALWTLGVSLRWMTGVYEWQWRLLLPVSAVLEITAFLLFFASVAGHRASDSSKSKLDDWILVVIAGSLGWLSSLVINLLASVFLAFRGESPVLPHSFDQRFLVLQTWGFLVPFVWGFSAKWLPVFLGLKSTRTQWLLRAVGINTFGVLAAMFGWMKISMVLLAAGIALAVYSLRLLESSDRPAKTTGVHVSFPLFVRFAYVWAVIAALLGVWASLTFIAPGIWGASQHALTVGFFAIMVFAFGQRVLPAFSGMKLLFSTKLMFWSLLLLSIGCLLRVSSQIVAYQGFSHKAWVWLPVSAITEMAAVALFAVNLLITFGSRQQNTAKRCDISHRHGNHHTLYLKQHS
jgi:uncharacterized protein involved in response to NO